MSNLNTTLKELEINYSAIESSISLVFLALFLSFLFFEVVEPVSSSTISSRNVYTTRAAAMYC